MKIAIAGTRGIPNNYGGFEQCAEFLSVLLAGKGHEVTVYNSHDHHPGKNVFSGVRIEHIYNPEKQIGTAGNFLYDYACMRHAVKNNFDILLMLGYTTASVFYPVINFRKTLLVTNMDGLEWKRDKWNSLVKKLAKWFEKLGALHSHCLVADNMKIREYLVKTYGRDAAFIAYGCQTFNDPDERSLERQGVTRHNYSILVARMEAENNIAMILEGYTRSGQQDKLLVVGNLTTEYGRSMESVYGKDPRIQFTGGIYDMKQLNNLRYFSRFYFHGHSVGGTNPSLLEAMASGAFIIAHGNEFNEAVLGEDAIYFTDAGSLSKLLNESAVDEKIRSVAVENNYRKVKNLYSWNLISEKYEMLFVNLLKP